MCRFLYFSGGQPFNSSLPHHIAASGVLNMGEPDIGYHRFRVSTHMFAIHPSSGIFEALIFGIGIVLVPLRLLLRFVLPCEEVYPIGFECQSLFNPLGKIPKRCAKIAASRSSRVAK